MLTFHVTISLLKEHFLVHLHSRLWEKLSLTVCFLFLNQQMVTEHFRVSCDVCCLFVFCIVL